MQEILTGLIVALDVVALYLLLPDVKKRFLLSLWTAILHMIFPIIGYNLGNWMLSILTQWSNLISSILLFFIGLQLILSTKNRQVIAIPLVILAITASLDTFSVSISFGMLNLQKHLFIMSAGIWTFVLSYISLYLAKSHFPIKGDILKWIAGISLLTISILTFINSLDNT
ncbi:manganese efflux pump MntP family protein [Lysinibacillus endophyticus]|uniref:manganese efflux pump MntP n=1 Tax=Ureibacillus endophyticus TaxID=1978490 RepID=UPI00209C99EA|nr:manganese efflux pump [Lysinibacillus endophyticus]MCP1143607.1 manganese efflux pump MntP family protein [Lysinibacillus endophyticus]